MPISSTCNLRILNLLRINLLRTVLEFWNRGETNSRFSYLIYYEGNPEEFINKDYRIFDFHSMFFISAVDGEVNYLFSC